MKTRRLQIAVIFILYSLSAFSQNSTSNTNFIQTLPPLMQDNRNYSHSNDEKELPVKDILSIIGSLGAVSAIAYGFIRHIHDASQRKKREQEEYLTTFNTIISNLSSSNKTAQLSSAILLRRYLNDTRKYTNLEDETIKVISSMAKTFPSGVLQKTLVDGLASAKDLSGHDLSKTNLQDIYLGNKERKILMNKTDLFLADLSYSLIQNIVGHEIIFYRSILLGAQIKDCDFTNANFVGADLTNTTFKNVNLSGANFSEAYNIPKEIKSKLVNGIYPDCTSVTVKHDGNGKSIFFSMPGKVEKNKEVIILEYKRILESKGYNVIYYNKDIYPSYGQFNRVREAINRSIGMIAFGLKQTNIHSATYRPNTDEQKEWEDVWISTPWSDIEVGMGLMKGIPILLVTDPEIDNGVFDENLSECYVANISSECDCKKIEQNQKFDGWISML